MLLLSYPYKTGGTQMHEIKICIIVTSVKCIPILLYKRRELVCLNISITSSVRVLIMASTDCYCQYCVKC